MKHYLSVLRKLRGKTWALIGFLVTLLAVFVFVGLRSGPLAPIPITVSTVENRSISPALFGVGTVQARYTYKIGPTAVGRVKSVFVQVGSPVKAGQLLGEMDPIDLDDRIGALDAALLRAQSTALVAEAQVQEVSARKRFAEAQLQRYEKLWADSVVSKEAVEIKRQEQQIAEAGLHAARANLEASRHEHLRTRAERNGLTQQRHNLRLIAPVAGLVSLRAADPGTTVIAGQSVIEIIDPISLWIHVRFDQLRAAGLKEGLPAQIVSRSSSEKSIPGRIARIELLADAVTEESLAKVVFATLPNPLPPIGELAEVTVALPPTAARPVISNASVQQRHGQLGVWVVTEDRLRFAPVKLGATDLDGRVQILEGLKSGERIVVHSQRPLETHSRFSVVNRLPGITP